MQISTKKYTECKYSSNG